MELSNTPTPQEQPQETPVVNTPLETPSPTPLEQQPETPAPQETPEQFDFNKVEWGESAGVINPADLSEVLSSVGLSHENEVVVNEINTLANQGFNKEQIAYLYQTYMGQPAQPTVQEVQERLAQNLTNEQKRDFQPVGQMVMDILPEDKKHVANDIMRNEELIGMFHSLYKKYVVGGNNSINNSNQQSIPTTSLTYAEALKGYQDAVKDMTMNGTVDRGRLADIRQELANRCTEPEKLLTVIG